jgi:AcrR family transcriptional regulator
VHSNRQGGERTNQKARTRRDLLDAARRILHTGTAPTVAQVADEAGVSRRTAYRYFPTVEQIVTEAALEETRPDIEAALANIGDAVDDVEERLARLAHALLAGFHANEHLLRTMIKITIDRPPDGTGPLTRGYRRLEWIDLAIAPLKRQLTRTNYERLKATLAVLLGTESFIVLSDLCGQNDAEIERTVIAAARALVTQGIINS